MTRESSLCLQNADSSRTLGAPSGSVWAAASPESAVSIRARRGGGACGEVERGGKKRGPLSICLISAVKSNHPPDSPTKRLSRQTRGAEPAPKHPRQGRHFPRCNHSWPLFMCFVYCCRELSYNQIEHLPSFYRCSSLQEMWVIQPPTPPHACQTQHFRFAHFIYSVCVCVCLNRGLQHNQIGRIESSTFQQLTSLRAL